MNLGQSDGSRASCRRPGSERRRGAAPIHTANDDHAGIARTRLDRHDLPLSSLRSGDPEGLVLFERADVLPTMVVGVMGATTRRCACTSTRLASTRNGSQHMSPSSSTTSAGGDVAARRRSARRAARGATRRRSVLRPAKTVGLWHPDISGAVSRSSPGAGFVTNEQAVSAAFALSRHGPAGLLAPVRGARRARHVDVGRGARCCRSTT